MYALNLLTAQQLTFKFPLQCIYVFVLLSYTVQYNEYVY